MHARTGNVQDFVTYDENFDQFLNGDSPNYELNSVSICDLGFSNERHNSYVLQINNYGKRLLEMCKSFNLFIANGRVGQDKSLGKKTCKGSSVVDYAILSPLLFTAVNDSEVLPFEPLVSDAHSGIYLSLLCTTINTGYQEVENVDIAVTKACWVPDASEAFINNLNINEINQFVDKVNSISQNDISQEEVETLVSECSSLLLNAADAAGMIKNKTIQEMPNRVERKCNSVKRPWFNANCQKLHLQYV